MIPTMTTRPPTITASKAGLRRGHGTTPGVVEIPNSVPPAATTTFRGLAKNAHHANDSSNSNTVPVSIPQFRGLRKDHKVPKDGTSSPPPNRTTLGALSKNSSKGARPHDDDLPPIERAVPQDIEEDAQGPSVDPEAEPGQEEETAVVPTSTHGDSHLAVALPVQDDNRVLSQAKEVDREEMEQKEIKEQKEKECRTIGCAIVAVCLLAIGLSLGFGLTSKNNQEELLLSLAPVPTMSPSMAPSPAPSSAPSGVLDVFQQTLPPYTIESLQISSSPQFQALRWLEDHPNITCIEEWRQRQLFALATFFYAMEGPTRWKPAARDRWMLHERSECFWFTSEFGFINDNGSYEEWKGYTPNELCNEKEEFRILNLQDVLLPSSSNNKHHQPWIPPEIALLTALTNLRLMRNELSGPIGEFLPSQFYNMENLTWVNLSINRLSGAIPSELGTMTSLSMLYLRNNILSGLVPSQLGKINSVMEMALEEIRLTGQLPSQLARLTNLWYLSLFSNRLTGTIPPSFDTWVSNRTGGGQFMTLFSRRQVLKLVNNDLSGNISDVLCSLELFDPSDFNPKGLSFDCNDQLCGCCWCPCLGGNANESCGSVYNPAVEDEEWPGQFPTSSGVVRINIQADLFPGETRLEWSVRTGPRQWDTLAVHNPPSANSLSSYKQEVDANATYRLQIHDSISDGICCASGLGWITITNSIPSPDHALGTVLWKAPTMHFMALEVYIQTDTQGHSHLVKYLE